MSSIDSYYKGKPREIERGCDDRGNYVIYKQGHEEPCSCHPETCCHSDGKIWVIEKYKIYDDERTKTNKDE